MASKIQRRIFGPAKYTGVIGCKTAHDGRWNRNTPLADILGTALGRGDLPVRPRIQGIEPLAGLKKNGGS